MIKEGRALDPFLSLHDFVNELDAAGQLTAVSPENRYLLGELMQQCADADTSIIEDTRMHELLAAAKAGKQLSDLGANLVGIIWNTLSVDQRRRAFTEPDLLKLEARAKAVIGMSVETG